MVKAHVMTIVHLFNDSEVQLLMLLSFCLQLFLFFFSGLRRRSRHKLLRVPLWLAYLSADSIAVYVLGYLSRHTHVTATSNDKLWQGRHMQTHKLTLLWAPFLLLHLGGQDNMTAFAIEDNELWLRHLLNLLVQMCLVIYVLFMSVAHNGWLVVPAFFVFIAGIIKYWERIWALKCSSQQGLRQNPISSNVEQQRTELQQAAKQYYSEIVVRYALLTERGVRVVFCGRHVRNMGPAFGHFIVGYGQGGNQYQMLFEPETAFKVVETELSMMYDTLFTKANVIQTTVGTILRCVSLASTIVAFVLFIMMSAGKQAYNYTRSDIAITYVLFIGAFFLEACAIFLVLTAPRAWASMEARGRVCKMLARAAVCIFMRTHPDKKPRWSNQMGQYNFLSSCVPDESWVGKLMSLVGATDIWENIRHTRHVHVTADTMKIISQTVQNLGPGNPRRYQPLHIRSPYSDEFKKILVLPFEEALLFLHVFTDLVLNKVASMCMTNHGVAIATQDTGFNPQRQLADTCKGLSDYMFYLLTKHPAMLPISGDLKYLLGKAADAARHSASIEKEFLEELVGRVRLTKPKEYYQRIELFEMVEYMLQSGQGQGVSETLEMLQQVWARLLVYAAGKSRAEEHARRLSLGGELLTMVWLLMAHWLGDEAAAVPLMPSYLQEEETRFLGKPVLFDL